jgi:ribosomal-protein-alanine N-acetyltransferase
VVKLLSDVAPFDSAADTVPLAALHAACFERAWDAATLSEMLAGPGTFAFAHPDGFVLARAAADEAEILTLAVRPSARGKGLGRVLLQAAIKKAHALGAATMFLEVGVDNPHALALYAGLGFAKVGTRKAYFEGRDALVLRLPLARDFA